ncbi:MAG: epoxyqueuosine reductase QueH [Gallicola sp.]|mgnify:CR=1 FL=1|nr:epoxyqueuosine reductase QueH [Gallicola sp.]
MNNKINYQKKLDQLLESIEGTPKLLLHSCCGPCSSYILEYLTEYFEIFLLYYNPNIYPEKEYWRRLEEQKDVIEKIEKTNPIHMIEGEFEPKDFYDSVKGLEDSGEGSERCFSCYRFRLEEAAKKGKEKGCDYFTTTLSISPYKNASKLNEIGQVMEEKYNIKYLYSDFKKKGGYQRSLELSRDYDLYRQDYCGCVFSKKERDERIEKR